MNTIAKKIYGILTSYGLAVVLFLLLFILILLGTLYQVDNGLYQAQKRYFNSVIAYHEAGPLVIPLPGAYTVMALLGVNLILGGLVRIRKSWKRPGVIIIHVGILVLIVSSAITFHFSERGYLRLYELEGMNTSDEIRSFHEWSIEIAKVGSDEPALVIEESSFTDLKPGEERTFHAESLPFDLVLTDYRKNALAIPVTFGGDSLDGYALETMPMENEAEANIPGIYAKAVYEGSEEAVAGILSGHARYPWTARFGDEAYSVTLDRKRFSIPFDVKLDDFVVERHPGTSMAASYESYITKTENGKEEKIRIWMNHPLRHKGLTFFQTSWGPQDAPEGAPLWSLFEVVRNPTDQGPLVACIIISIGFLIHFTQKLLGYMRVESKRRTA